MRSVLAPRAPSHGIAAGRVTALVDERLEMVGDEHRVEAGFLGQHSESQQVAGAELLSGGLVAEAQGNGHGRSPQFVVIRMGGAGVGEEGAGVGAIRGRRYGASENRPLRSRKVCA